MLVERPASLNTGGSGDIHDNSRWFEPSTGCPGRRVTPILISASKRFGPVHLLANAELAEDEVENVVACCGAGEGVECLESFVEIEEDDLVGDCCYCLL